MDRYAVKALILLSKNPMTLYQMSKEISSDGQVSHGTILPMIRKLLQEGFIEFEIRGREKIYHLTKKGDRFVESISKIEEDVKQNLISRAMGDAFFYLNLLSKDDTSEAIKAAIQLMLPVIVAEVEYAFRMIMGGHREEVEDMARELLRRYGEIDDEQSLN
ncbi:PadR family transcriptional regulator [Thermoplasma sp.]|uniref:PadR family transcriptional regulator n=1 Tax=Thermoplasma sp. TaxID=1973142 RepID=UPI001284AD12|nr:PadR family transcriptional regulator [Thermoplasma sp.]KAA8922990.1 MAG: PadR family transcriptional regulator [Thermoplasma sp.]